MPSIRITHTHADGTILTGSSKGDGVYEIVRQHGFRWSPHVGIYIRGSRDHRPQLGHIEGAKKALEDAGFTVEVDIDDRARATVDVEADRARRASQRLRESGPTTERRIQGLEADRRKVERDRQPCKTSGMRTKDGTDGTEVTCPRCYEHVTVTDRQIPDHGRRISEATAKQRLAEIDDQLAYWRKHLADLAESGQYRKWGPDDFAKGDYVQYWGGWRQVLKVNRKSLTVPSGYSWNDTVTFDKVTGRRSKEEHEGQQRPEGATSGA